MVGGGKPEYTVIDTDPHFSRVLRYMRPVDYATWAGMTAAAPGLLLAWERVDPSASAKRALRSGVRINTFLGFFAGFMLAYQNSSKRFWGWNENERERQRDFKELSARAAQGLPLYGESELTPHMQAVAAGNSMGSQLMFGAIPWFNLVNHPHHGVDTSIYYNKSSDDQSSQPS